MAVLLRQLLSLNVENAHRKMDALLREDVFLIG